MTDDLKVSVQANDLRRLSQALKAVDDKSLMRELRKGLRAAADPVAADARALAPSPAVAKTVTVETAFTAKKAGVFISAKRNKMPSGHEALPGLFEMGSSGNARTFRHPLFGDKENWYEQDVRPFLQPALARHEAQVEAAIGELVNRTLAANGL